MTTNPSFLFNNFDLMMTQLQHTTSIDTLLEAAWRGVMVLLRKVYLNEIVTPLHTDHTLLLRFVLALRSSFKTFFAGGGEGLSDQAMVRACVSARPCVHRSVSLVCMTVRACVFERMQADLRHCHCCDEQEDVSEEEFNTVLNYAKMGPDQLEDEFFRLASELQVGAEGGFRLTVFLFPPPPPPPPLPALGSRCGCACPLPPSSLSLSPCPAIKPSSRSDTRAGEGGGAPLGKSASNALSTCSSSGPRRRTCPA